MNEHLSCIKKGSANQSMNSVHTQASPNHPQWNSHRKTKNLFTHVGDVCMHQLITKHRESRRKSIHTELRTFWLRSYWLIAYPFHQLLQVSPVANAHPTEAQHPHKVTTTAIGGKNPQELRAIRNQRPLATHFQMKCPAQSQGTHHNPAGQGERNCVSEGNRE